MPEPYKIKTTIHNYEIHEDGGRFIVIRNINSSTEERVMVTQVYSYSEAVCFVGRQLINDGL